MRITGSLAKGLVAALVLTLVPLVAFSAQKITPGSTCKVKQQKITYQNKVFTCIKSGNKLVWNKGVSNSSTTAPTPVPIAPAPAPVEIRISIDNLDLKQVPLKAFKNVEQEIKTRTRANFYPTQIVSPLVPKQRIEQELSGLNRAIDLWAPYFQPDKFQVIYAVGGDEDWLETKSGELGLSSMLPPGQTWSRWMRLYTPCGGAIAASGNGVPTFVQCLGRPYSGGTKQTGPHEYTHLFQMGYGGRNAHMLRWYTEGSASYFGWTLGFYPTDLNLNERSSWLSSMYNNLSAEAKSDFQSKDLQKFKNRLKMLTPSSDQSVATTSYWVGGLATEVLVALYGFDKFVEFTKNIQSNSDMSSLLMQTYGFDEDYFYEKLAPYVWAQVP